MDINRVSPPEFGDAAVPLRVWELLVVDANGCWVWQGSVNSAGYGLTRAITPVEDKPLYIHRALFERLVGPIADRLELDHLCRNPPCANPAHLDPVTHRENLLRSPIAQAAINARKTHCKRGHPFDRPYEPGKGRTCQVCLKEYRRTYRRVETPERKAYRLEWNRKKRERLQAKRAAGEPLTRGEMAVLGMVKKVDRGEQS